MGTCCFREPEPEDDDELDKLIAKYPVVVFSKTTCSLCDDAKSILEETGVDFAVVELDTCPEFEKIGNLLIAKTGQTTVPAVFINGSYVKESRDLSQLQASGQLESMLKESIQSTSEQNTTNVKLNGNASQTEKK